MSRMLRVVGDGTWRNTRVEDVETGERIAGIVGIKLDLSYDRQLVQLDVPAERCQLDLTLPPDGLAIVPVEERRA